MTGKLTNKPLTNCVLLVLAYPLLSRNNAPVANRWTFQRVPPRRAGAAKWCCASRRVVSSARQLRPRPQPHNPDDLQQHEHDHHGAAVSAGTREKCSAEGEREQRQQQR